MRLTSAVCPISIEACSTSMGAVLWVFRGRINDFLIDACNTIISFRTAAGTTLYVALFADSTVQEEISSVIRTA